MAVSEELSVFTENNHDAASSLAFPQRQVGLGQQTTPHLITSTAGVEVIIRSYRITVCVKYKENSYLVYPTLKITTDSQVEESPVSSSLILWISLNVVIYQTNLQSSH